MTNMATAEMAAGIAKTRKVADVPSATIAVEEPMIGPTIAPARPQPRPQPMPVERMSVG